MFFPQNSKSNKTTGKHRLTHLIPCVLWSRWESNNLWTG